MRGGYRDELSRSMMVVTPGRYHPGIECRPGDVLMSEVSFRFYAQLNDFLPANRRGRRFTHVLGAPASVKDVIEALGVPHPEVDVILVNGTAEDFTCRLRDGDDV